MKKIALVLMVLVLAMGMVFAGGKKEKTNDGVTTIKWALWDYDQTVYYKPLIEAFEAANPNIKIEPLDLGSTDYSTMLSTQLTGGDSSIDVVTIKDIPGYATLVKAGQLLDLNDYIKANKIDLSVYSGGAEQVNVDGHQYDAAHGHPAAEGNDRQNTDCGVSAQSAAYQNQTGTGSAKTGACSYTESSAAAPGYSISA